MPPVKTVYVPRFGSQQGSSQRNEPQPEQQTPDQTEASSQSQRDKSGKRRGDGGREKAVMKVKLPKFNSRSLVGKVTNGDVRWTLEPAKTPMNPGGETQSAGTDSAPDDGSVFFFSQTFNVEATDEKEKAKLSVLRTISKMLEENQFIRQRLAALSQTT